MYGFPLLNSRLLKSILQTNDYRRARLFSDIGAVPPSAFGIIQPHQSHAIPARPYQRTRAQQSQDASCAFISLICTHYRYHRSSPYIDRTLLQHARSLANAFGACPAGAVWKSLAVSGRLNSTHAVRKDPAPRKPSGTSTFSAQNAAWHCVLSP